MDGDVSASNRIATNEEVDDSSVVQVLQPKGIMDIPREIFDYIVEYLPIFGIKNTVSPHLARLSRSCQACSRILRPQLAQACASLSKAYPDGPWRKMWDTIWEEVIEEQQPLGDWRGLVRVLDLAAPQDYDQLENYVPPEAVLSQFSALQGLRCRVLSYSDAERVSRCNFPLLVTFIAYDHTTVKDYIGQPRLTAVQMPRLQEFICHRMYSEHKPFFDSVLSSCPGLEKRDPDLHGTARRVTADRAGAIVHVQWDLWPFCRFREHGYEWSSVAHGKLSPKVFAITADSNKTPAESNMTMDSTADHWPDVCQLFDKFIDTKRLEAIFTDVRDLGTLALAFPGGSAPKQVTLRVLPKVNLSENKPISPAARQFITNFDGHSLHVALFFPTMFDKELFGNQGQGRENSRQFAQFLDFWIRELPILSRAKRNKIKIAFGPLSARQVPKQFCAVMRIHRLLDTEEYRSIQLLADAFERIPRTVPDRFWCLWEGNCEAGIPGARIVKLTDAGFVDV